MLSYVPFERLEKLIFSFVGLRKVFTMPILCILVTYCIISLMDIFISIWAIYIWWTEKPKCIIDDPYSVSYNMYWMGIIKIVIHFLEILSHWYVQDPSQQSITKSYWTGVFAIHMIVILWIFTITFPTINLASLQVDEQCNSKSYIVGIIFIIWTIIMVAIRIVLHCIETWLNSL